MRIGPRHPRLGAAGFKLARALFEPFYRHRAIHRADSDFARGRIAAIRAKIERGERVHLAGLSAAGMHNSGVALIEVTRESGPRLLLNNEEERFSGNKHTTEYPRQSIAAMTDALARVGLTYADVDGWFASWDSAVFCATLVRSVLEELPGSLPMLSNEPTPVFSLRDLDRGMRAARRLGEQLGAPGPVPLIATAHHDNHAWFSYAASPFAQERGPVLVAVFDGVGDTGSISFYRCDGARMERLFCNDSVADSLGIFYSVISSTQGGWTWLSSEGRYMGATAYGNNDRATNPYYAALKPILVLGDNGAVHVDRDLANWQCDILHKPYKPALIGILGEPIDYNDMWNPDAVLRVEDIKHKDNTQDRLDKAAATQMVFEDALMHVLAHYIKTTRCDRLVFTGGLGLNALANMRLLEHFDDDWFRREMGRPGRLHLWVPPTPNDTGVTIGAAYMGAYLAGYGLGAPVEHAFYCGLPPAADDIRAAFAANPDVASIALAPCDSPAVRAAYADFMAYMTSQDAIFALYQGAAETGPRALGHRSILANPCNPRTRENLNAQVKYREAIRPLAPMATLEAAQQFFQLSDGASDADYNAYNYMVLTAHAKPEAHARIPSVVHADGTGRLQIVREATDPLTYAYLKALGRRIGVEVAVNTSFNVAGPIAQTPAQALDTLKRSKGLDAVLMFADEGPVFAALHGGSGGEGGARFRQWLSDWQRETGRRIEP
jgi:carbamoyltransferase